MLLLPEVSKYESVHHSPFEARILTKEINVKRKK
jgi:hypothetical protein